MARARGVTIAMLVFFVAAIVVAAVASPAGAVYRRLRRRGASGPLGLRRLRRLTGLAGVLGLAFLLGFVVHFAVDQVGLLSVSPAFRALLLLPLALAAIAVASAVLVIRVWLRQEGASAVRLYHSGVVLALLALIPFLYHFRLLGYHY